MSSPFGQITESIRAPQSGYVIGLNHLPLVTVGTAIAHIGTSETKKKAKNKAIPATIATLVSTLYLLEKL